MGTFLKNHVPYHTKICNEDRKINVLLGLISVETQPGADRRETEQEFFSLLLCSCRLGTQLWGHLSELPRDTL